MTAGLPASLLLKYVDCWGGVGHVGAVVVGESVKSPGGDNEHTLDIVAFAFYCNAFFLQHFCGAHIRGDRYCSGR